MIWSTSFRPPPAMPTTSASAVSDATSGRWAVIPVWRPTTTACIPKTFGIASSENGLYDVARIEVLRGPQGTLYGRNSIGGALNYITNQPTYEFEGELRAMVGNLGTQEYYGIVSGPLIKDRLAARVVGLKRDRDGSIDGDNGSERHQLHR
jgi:outer membrane receptor for ferric coprogen and ferric-rhodotorulic acid